MPMHPGGGHAPKPKAPTNFQEHAYSPKCLEEAFSEFGNLGHWAHAPKLREGASWLCWTGLTGFSLSGRKEPHR